MPKVSDAHLAARREQIVAAARRCFARQGFQATSMQDVIAEAGLSVGAVYRYFRSKDDLRDAVAEEALASIAAALGVIAAHDPPLALADALSEAVGVLEELAGGPEPEARVAVHAWSEALRDPDLAALLREGYRQVRDQFVAIARRAQEQGDLAAEADPEAVGTILFTLAPGYLVQRLLVGDVAADGFVAGLRSLLR